MVTSAWALMKSAMVNLIKLLNHISHDYRYIMKVLTLEKKMLKVQLYITVKLDRRGGV